MYIFSAVIPVSVKANNQHNLIQWLDSQDYTKIEVIVILDEAGATIEQKIEAQNAFSAFAIKVLSDDFGSPGLARNAGLQSSLGEWIAFWDADDLPLIGNFQQMVQEANQKGLDICAGDYIFRNLKSGVSKIRKLPRAEYPDALPAILGKDPGIWRFAFRKEVLNRKFKPIRMAEDQIFLMENNIFTHEIYLSDKLVYCYFYGGAKQSTSNNSLIGDLKSAISTSADYVSTCDSLRQSYFASMLLARQTLTAVKRGSFKLKLWSICEFIRNFFELNREKKSFFLRIFRSMVVRRNFRKEHIYVPLTGGLGNQLFQFAYLLNKSKDSEGSFLLNIGAPRLNHLGVPELLSYKISSEKIEVDPPSSNWLVKKSSGYMLRVGVNPMKFDEFSLIRNGAQLAWKLILSISFGQKITPLAGKGVGYFESNERAISNFDYGYFQSYKWADTVLGELKQLTLAEPSISLSIYSELAKKDLPLIVHVRLSDYRVESNFGFPGVSYYSTAINHAWATGKFSSIWVFSDEINAARECLPSEHADHYRFIEDRNLSSAEVLEIMRLGEGYVIANSTFSWWGAYLSRSSNPLIIAPQPWFSKVESPRDLIPGSWLSIETIQSENRFKDSEGDGDGYLLS